MDNETVFSPMFRKKANNYVIQAENARKLFLGYDAKELARKFSLKMDETYLYAPMMGREYRIERSTGRMEKKIGEIWADGGSFAETLTLFDVLCDSKPRAKLSGSWKAMRDFGLQFHQGLLEQDDNPDAAFFDAHPEVLTKGCLALGGVPMPGADLGYAVPAVLGVPIWVQFWHSDEEFAPRIRYLWDENALQFIRYETMWYAVGLLLERIKEEGHQ